MENGNGSFSDKDTLFMLSGVALLVFGAGLILTSPIARRYMGRLGIGDLAITGSDVMTALGWEATPPSDEKPKSKGSKTEKSTDKTQK